jgi:hypothetical protein
MQTPAYYKSAADKAEEAKRDHRKNPPKYWFVIKDSGVVFGTDEIGADWSDFHQLTDRPEPPEGWALTERAVFIDGEGLFTLEDGYGYITADGEASINEAYLKISDVDEWRWGVRKLTKKGSS